MAPHNDPARRPVSVVGVQSGSEGAPEPGSRWQMRFWAVFGGQSMSLLGSSLTQFALLWWITDTTGSLSALATAGMVALLPQALLAPLGGTLADRYSRRLLMIVSDAISALCMVVLIALFLIEEVQLAQVYVMMAIRSAMQAFQAPAAAASVAMLVPRSFLTRASGFNQAAQSMTVVAAAPLGALAMGLMPIGWVLAIDVVTAVIGLVPLLFIAIPQPMRSEAGGHSLVNGLWREFRAGVQLVWSHPGLRRLYALITGVVMIVMPSFTLVPLLVKDHFGGGAEQVALMEGLSGLGMLLGGLAVAGMAPRRHILWVLLGFAASCLSIAVAAAVPKGMFVVAVAWWTISGLTFVFGNAPLMALLQSTLPLNVQGRALSLLSALMGVAAPVGLGLLVPLGEQVGVQSLFIGMGVLGMVVSLAGLSMKDVRNLRAACL